MKGNIVPLMVVQFFIFLGFGMIIPVLPEIITNLHVPSHHLGMLLSSYSLASFLTAPLWGKISDRAGRRPVLLIGILGYSISFFLTGLLIDNLTGLYIARSLNGLFAGALYTAATGLFLIPFITNLLWAGICLSIFTAGNALVRTCTLSFLTKQIKSDHGTISGLNYSFDSLGRIIGPIFFTMIFTSQGAISFIVGGMITMLSIGFVILFSKKQHTYGSEL
ncbi:MULTISPECIES: MFS transporter [Bacillus cereus group]|uniref:MFS transporter n=1 Tax=Bacillus cereus group TaxID=86661 RepID=UPI0002E9AA13|nr:MULTISPECIES: MFS transporter [Bacillus cereus group]MBR9658527.1 MFS transporter [Bacillus cereus]MCU4902597.1 MFS transporter [Bacillus cereus]MCU5315500.1 MFS transporter [Bacillus cereus]MCU5440045.1 MFS transporter [Bacillus cereus]MCU5483998.1 MFS transporter [Bacillus cereus]